MLKTRVLEALQRRQDELAALCARLIQIPSENPPGDTAALASAIRDHLGGLGVPVEWHEPMPGRPNLVATLGSGPPNLVLSGHLDEFPAGSGWTRPAFSGAIEDGRIWGRGAGDMKSGLAVALMVTALVRELRVPLRGRLTLAFASDEETGGEWGTQWLLANVPAVRGDACLIGESSGTWSAGIGEKGVLWLRLTGRGVSGHAAYRQGTSAVDAVLAAVAALEGLSGKRAKAGAKIEQVIARQRREAERRWGRGTGRLADTLAVSVGTLQGGGQVNLIPSSAMAEIDLRLPPGLTTDAIAREARRRVEKATGGAVDVEVFNACDPYVSPPDAPLVRSVLANAKAINGRAVLPVVRLGYTDGRFFRRAGIPTVVYGPAVYNMGGPDEYVETADLFEIARVHAAAVVDMLAPEAA